MLTDVEINNLLNSNCYYCEKPNADGIDRVDSNKNYTTDNVVPCCEICNRMKNKYSLTLFLSQVTKIYNNLINKKGSTTIPKGSTLQANGSGSGGHPKKDGDIVSTPMVT